jgi:hypothetical protein
MPQCTQKFDGASAVDVAIGRSHPGTHTAGHPLQRLLVAEPAAALGFRLLLHLGAACDVAAHRADDVQPREPAQDHPDAGAHVAAVAREIRHQLEEEREEREQHEPAEQRPVLALSPADDEPGRDEQEGKGEREPNGEHAQLLLELRALVLPARGGGQLHLFLVLRLQRLRCAQPRLVEPLHFRLRRPLAGLELVELLRAAEHLGVLARIGRGDAGGDPVVEALVARAVGVGRRLSS